MPYIKLTERNKFAGSIAEIMGVLGDANDTPYLKGEYFGYFLNRLVKRFLADPDYTQNSFNSAFFNESKKKTLINAADSMAAMINRADPIASAGELNYAISAVMWGYFGETRGFGHQPYGVRAYWAGIVEKVSSSLDSSQVAGSQRDMTMAFRRQMVIRGVMSDVLNETYRLKTAPMQEGQIVETGDIWQDGRLLVGAPPKE